MINIKGKQIEDHSIFSKKIDLSGIPEGIIGTDKLLLYDFSERKFKYSNNSAKTLWIERSTKIQNDYTKDVEITGEDFILHGSYSSFSFNSLSEFSVNADTGIKTGNYQEYDSDVRDYKVVFFDSGDLELQVLYLSSVQEIFDGGVVNIFSVYPDISVSESNVSYVNIYKNNGRDLYVKNDLYLPFKNTRIKTDSEGKIIPYGQEDDIDITINKNNDVVFNGDQGSMLFVSNQEGSLCYSDLTISNINIANNKVLLGIPKSVLSDSLNTDISFVKFKQSGEVVYEGYCLYVSDGLSEMAELNMKTLIDLDESITTVDIYDVIKEDIYLSFSHNSFLSISNGKIVAESKNTAFNKNKGIDNGKILLNGEDLTMNSVQVVGNSSTYTTRKDFRITYNNDYISIYYNDVEMHRLHKDGDIEAFVN